MLLYFIGLGSSEAVVAGQQTTNKTESKSKKGCCNATPHTTAVTADSTHCNALTHTQKEREGELKAPLPTEAASICSRLMVASIAMHLKGLKTNI
jgi:hypothetical protein